MPATAEARDPVRMATSLFEWYLQPTEAEEALQNVIDAADTSAAFNVAGLVNPQLLLKQIHRAEDFAEVRQALLRKWSPRFEHEGGINVADAQAILREWAESIDHRLLFIHAITAGSTHARRNVPASDFVTSYHADRSAWTLHLTTRGAVEYSAGIPVRARRGDLVLIAPDASVHYRRQAGHDEWFHYWVLFQPEPGWTELMRWPMRSYGMYLLSIEQEDQVLQFESLFEQMLELYQGVRPLLDRLLRNLVEQVLIRAQELLASEDLCATDPRVLKASDYMNRNLCRMRSVSEVAAECNLSESRLAHLFQQHLGMGVQKYRNCLRMQRAKRLLVTTGVPISGIARQVGYDDPAQFSRFFSRSTGCSPRQFRASFPADRIRTAPTFAPPAESSGERFNEPRQGLE